MSSQGQVVGNSISSSSHRANTSMPIVKSVTPVHSHTRTSVVYPVTNSQPGSALKSPLTTNTSATGYQKTYHQSLTGNIQSAATSPHQYRMRNKSTVQTNTQRLLTHNKPSATITVSRPGMVIPVGSASSSGAGSSIMTARSLTGNKPGIHIKQEGG